MRRWLRWALIQTGLWLLNLAFVFYVKPDEWHIPVVCILITCAQIWALLYLLRVELDKL